MPSIGKMKDKICFVFQKITQDEHGEYTQVLTYGDPFSARLTQLNLGFKRIENNWNEIQKQSFEKIYKLVMRKKYVSDALQANLVGVLFKSRVHKLLNSLQSTNNHQWVEALIVDYGVTRKQNG
ncbi:MAG: hypothetical protein KBD31_04295 [Proteobacteria bacterium]|nr:hypothetical protein [Pseudomonadota bacterium]